MTRRLSGIYKIENTHNGKLYIGQTTQVRERLLQHKRLLKRDAHYNTHLQRSWNKHGDSRFAFSVVLYCEDYEATYYEQKIVDILDPSYNIRKKCVVSNYGRTMSDETKKKLSIAHTGRVFTEEHKKKLSLAKVGKPGNAYGTKRSVKQRLEYSRKYSGKNHSQYGTHRSEETKKKISLAQKGSKSYWYGKKRSEEAKRKTSETLKKTWTKRKKESAK